MQIDLEETNTPENKDIDISTINTVYAIKDGMFEVVELEELKKKNYFYRVHSKIAGVAVIDYDKTNIVPIVKDILNRQNTFIEISYLRWVIALNIILIIGSMVLGLMIFKKSAIFDAPKAEIIAEIRKSKALPVGQEETQRGAPVILKQKAVSPPATPSPGYNPVLPEETTENTHKNIPSYAN